MFVSVVLDPGGIDSAKSIAEILTRYSFKKIQSFFPENILSKTAPILFAILINPRSLG